MVERYASAGLAHSAADDQTVATGIPHGMLFWPRGLRDRQPFIVDTMDAIHFRERRG